MLLKKSSKYPTCTERQSRSLDLSQRIRTECVFAHESLMVTEIDSWTRRVSIRVMQLPHPPRLPPIDLSRGPEIKRPRPSKETRRLVERQLRQRILWQQRKRFIENAGANGCCIYLSNDSAAIKESQSCRLSSASLSSSVGSWSNPSSCFLRNPIGAKKKKKTKMKAEVFGWLLSRFNNVVPLKKNKNSNSRKQSKKDDHLAVPGPPQMSSSNLTASEITLSQQQSSALESNLSSVSLGRIFVRRPCFTESNFTL